MTPEVRDRYLAARHRVVAAQRQLDAIRPLGTATIEDRYLVSNLIITLTSVEAKLDAVLFTGGTRA